MAFSVSASKRAAARASRENLQDMYVSLVERHNKVTGTAEALKVAAQNQLSELSQHQTCTQCGCGVDEPESVALRAAIDKLEGGL